MSVGINKKSDFAEKPSSIDDYKKWLKNKFDIIADKRLESYYDSVARKIKSDFELSAFWKLFSLSKNDIDQEYFLKTSFHLFSQDNLPILLIKQFDSFLLKTFRINVLNNSNFPNEPKGGWVLPDNCFEKINDIVRTSITVKYLDGVEFLIKKLDNFCNDCSVCSSVDFEAKEEGYYAAHFYPSLTFNLPLQDWDTFKAKIQIEIQVTTQLQEIIKRLLHSYYEKHRIEAVNSELIKSNLKWQWDYQSDEFATNYLGHILHYIEGMIMEIRVRQKGVINDSKI